MRKAICISEGSTTPSSQPHSLISAHIPGEKLRSGSLVRGDGMPPQCWQHFRGGTGAVQVLHTQEEMYLLVYVHLLT